MNKLISILSLSILLIIQIDGSINEIDIPCIDYSLEALEKNYSSLYRSGVYENHLKQTQDFVKNFDDNLALSENEKTLITALLSPFPEETFEKGMFQIDLINQLRKTVNETSTSSPFLDAYTYWLFTEPKMTEAVKEYMEGTFGIDENQVSLIYQQDSKHLFENGYHYLSSMGVPSSVEIEENYANDPLLYGDFPSVQFIWNNKKKTKIVRLPNMARDYFVVNSGKIEVQSIINEEFYHYLKVLKTKRQMHVYINLMDRQEYQKTAQIEALDTDPDVRDSIRVFTLVRNKKSEFYMQNGVNDQKDDANLFKQNFYQLLTAPDGEYYWSTHLDQNAWQNQLAAILDQVHSDFFNYKENLSKQERLEFIELTHLKIVDSIVEWINPDFVNISCKNTADRGPSLYSLVYAEQLLQSKTTLSTIRYEVFIKLISPPLIIRNRNGHLFRYIRFDGAFNRLMDHYKNPLP